MSNDPEAWIEEEPQTLFDAKIGRRSLLAGAAGAMLIGGGASGIATKAQAQGAPLSWFSTGTGDPVVFIHGAGGMRRSGFNKSMVFARLFRP
ncbi:hypothetical protein [Sulfitobacter aestuariivivens]|uniref:hypothetical protein n=1 Tax=Sulfitobacter aestuariivivens TaxID=2766981 RepID=UPI0036223BF2